MYGKIIGTTLGALDRFSLVTYAGVELGWREGSTDGAVDGKLGGFLLGD